ncbi:uncharacterized protein LOC114147574 [Xiphophorus couchianus]|uniref:uncharacterized protein LOC114147574 n=1 Tax=Xiphophorus couchianus TaxID=32473 RepID=UPI001016358C|nr:uncharacterized protein LOC114147574 [Xiphophorus couchianus]
MDQQDQQGSISADENADEGDWVKPDIPTTSASSPECQKCPICKSSLIPSTTVFYHVALKDCVPNNPQEEENSVSSTENQNQAAETKKNSLWCSKCEVNFVTLNKVEEGLQRILNMGLEVIGQLYSKVVSILSYLTGSSPQSYPIVKFSSLITGETYDAYQALMEKVRNKIPATLVEEVNPKDAHAVLVFCPITSRVGSDVESAMAKPEVSSLDKPVILVLMHHTRDPDYSTAGTKWSDMNDNVKLDVHVLFHETVPGLLTCQQNDQAIEALVKELDSYKEYST